MVLRKSVIDIVHDQHLICLPETADVREAAKLMKKRDIGAVLVMNDNELRGILTKRDIIHRVVAKGLEAEKTSLKKVMTQDPHIVEPGETSVEALHRMELGNFRYLPVVDQGKVVGILSRRDFVGEERAKLLFSKRYSRNIDKLIAILNVATAEGQTEMDIRTGLADA